MRLGSAGLELKLTNTALDNRNRRSGASPVEQLESRSSIFSGLDGEADSLHEIKTLEFHFYETNGKHLHFTIPTCSKSLADSHQIAMNLENCLTNKTSDELNYTNGAIKQ